MSQPPKLIPLKRVRVFMLSAATVSIVACGEPARLPVSAGIGPRPVLSPPSISLIPTINVVSAKGWSAKATPVAVEGTTVGAFARRLDHPRRHHFLIRLHRGLAAALRQMLPATDYRWRDRKLAAQLRKRDAAPQNPLDLLALKVCK